MKTKEQNKEIRELTDDELAEKIKTTAKEYTKLKINHSISPLESPIQIRQMRRNIARLKTEQRSREINNAQ